jgi:hypothetical protein
MVPLEEIGVFASKKSNAPVEHQNHSQGGAPAAQPDMKKESYRNINQRPQSTKGSKGVPMVRSFGRMPNTWSFCFTASSKKQRPSILKGGVDDAVGRGGLRLETHSQIAPGAAPAAQPDMKKESAKGVPLEEIELLNVTSTKGVPTAEIHQRLQRSAYGAFLWKNAQYLEFLLHCILKKATPLHFEGRGGRRSRPGWVAFRNPFPDRTRGRASGAA